MAENYKSLAALQETAVGCQTFNLFVLFGLFNTLVVNRGYLKEIFSILPVKSPGNLAMTGRAAFSDRLTTRETVVQSNRSSRLK